MRFFNLTLCSMLLHFQYPWFMVRYLAFNLSLKSNWAVLLLLPLLFLGLVFYLTGPGLIIFLLRAKKVTRQDWVLAGLERLRLNCSFSTLETIKEAFRKEDIPFSMFEEEQKRLGIFGSYLR